MKTVVIAKKRLADLSPGDVVRFGYPLGADWHLLYDVYANFNGNPDNDETAFVTVLPSIGHAAWTQDKPLNDVLSEWDDRNVLIRYATDEVRKPDGYLDRWVLFLNPYALIDVQVVDEMHHAS